MTHSLLIMTHHFQTRLMTLNAAHKMDTVGNNIVNMKNKQGNGSVEICQSVRLHPIDPNQRCQA